MPMIEGEVLIDRPVEIVFDFVADERHEPSYNHQMVGVEKRTPGPIGPGTRWAATMATRGRMRDMIIEVTDFERPTRLGSTSTLSTGEVRGTLTFAPVGGGTRMQWSWEVRPHGILRLLAPVVWLVGRRQEARVWAGLKRVLEQDRG